MPRDSRYDILFEPVKIGPVTAPNRFYQTPHATGLGWRGPQANAALRGLKAEGGWGVVCTEYCSIHPSSDDSPFAFLTLWDDDDIAPLAKTADAIHAHGALAGIELWHGGAHSNNRMTREPLLSPSGARAHFVQPASTRAMDLADIRDFVSWQARAAERAKRAGFDIVYVYAGHDYLPFQFLSPRTNRRCDDYGGSIANRTRLLREMIEATREATQGACAVALRMAVDELQGPGGITHDGEAAEIVSTLAELPDLWDVNVAGLLGNDSKSARFSPEGFQEPYVRFVKGLTTKPVVSVGRFTSPETMRGQIARGIQDFIGAARPSIADPFLPRKIAEGREDEIRECIGCNICRAANNEGVAIRCTQNPTMGEEWRRGWHPERIPRAASDAQVLIVGGGPSGLECALALGRRGYKVTLAERSRELGGRILAEASLPGLATWLRVRDWRRHMLGKLGNVEIYLESAMTAADIAAFGAGHVVIATGSRWRLDGLGAVGEVPLSLPDDPAILTPDDIFAGAAVVSPVLVYDDDHYAMGGALAEKLARAGHSVTYATPLPVVSSWTQMTDEQPFVAARLADAGVTMLTSRRLVGTEAGVAHFTDGALPFTTLVLVTGRLPEDALYRELVSSPLWGEEGAHRPLGRWEGEGRHKHDQRRPSPSHAQARGPLPLPDGERGRSITRIGDCLVPSHIADAVFSGHRFAREFEEAPQPVKRERPAP